MNFWRQLGDWGFLLFALGLLLLGTGFLGFTRWRKTPTGRGIGAFFICSNAIITLSFLRLFGWLEPDDWWFYPARALVFGGGGLAVLVVGIGFIRLQFLQRRSGDRTKHELTID